MDSNEEAGALQLKKLSLEIAELERPWWKRPNYILAALPTLLAIAALSVGFLNGFFSAQLTKLENQRHDLEAQIKDFEAKRDGLYKEYDDAKRDLDSTKAELEALRLRATPSELERTFLARELAREKESRQKCETGLEKLKAQKG